MLKRIGPGTKNSQYIQVKGLNRTIWRSGQGIQEEGQATVSGGTIIAHWEKDSSVSPCPDLMISIEPFEVSQICLRWLFAVVGRSERWGREQSIKASTTVQDKGIGNVICNLCICRFTQRVETEHCFERNTQPSKHNKNGKSIWILPCNDNFYSYRRDIVCMVERAKYKRVAIRGF